MDVVIGLGPIGANVGLRLRERGRRVVGLDLDEERAARWSSESGALAVSRFEEVDWPDVETVTIAVRVAPQLEGCLDALTRVAGAEELSISVLTTLTSRDAAAILGRDRAPWRIFEAPLSGGPQGARAGTMSVFLAGPSSTPTEDGYFADIAGRVFRTAAYGEPAFLKLANNTLGAFNAVATARMLAIAVDHGLPAEQFLEVVNASSGQSWMSTNYDNFHYDLLFKDVRLFIEDHGALPVVDLNETGEHELDAEIESSRRGVFGDSAYLVS